MNEDATTKAPYKVLARKYRPHVFDDLIGQDPMVQTLSNAFKSGRIAQAYMLTGVRGVGKTTTARILARALNYVTKEQDQPSVEMPEEGDHCRSIMEGRHMDVIEMDAASHTGIDEMRDLIESAQYKPATARYKVYIIDEVHMLSKSAFNGLLKTLEEPPEHLKFIFATTEIRKVPVTVLSRCQRFDLRRIKSSELVRHLSEICAKEGVEAEEDGLLMIARASEGSVRDALSILDQAIAHSAVAESKMVTAEAVRSLLGLSDKVRIIELFEYVMKGDVSAALEELRSQYEIGAEPDRVLADLAGFIHLVTRMKFVSGEMDDLALAETERNRARDYSKTLSVTELSRSWQILLSGLKEVRGAEHTMPVAEMVLIRLTHASTLPSPEQLLETGQMESPSAGANGSSSNEENRKGAAEKQSTFVSETPVVPTPGSSEPVAVSQAEAALAIDTSPPEAEPAEVSQTSSTAQQARALNSFEELIYLVEDQRDLKLKLALRKHVRLVSFSNGRIDMNLVENPPRNFLSFLATRLEEWTGKRWMLSVSSEQGQPTLQEQEEAEDAEKTREAMSDPAVEKVLSVFPGAKVVDIRIRENENTAVPVDPDSEPSP